jgi:hypothetical protein
MFDGSAKRAFVVAALVLIVCGAGFRASVRRLGVYLQKEPIELRQRLSSIPKSIGGWAVVGDDVMLDAAMVEALGTDRYLNRTYIQQRADGRHVIALHVAYYTGMIDAVPHIPDRCFVAAGWEPLSLPVNHDLALNFAGQAVDPPPGGDEYLWLGVRDPVTGQVEQVHLPRGEFKLRTRQFVRRDSGEGRMHAGFFFIANGATSSMPARVRLYAFDASQKYAYYAKIQLSMMSGDGDEADQFVELSEDLLEKLMPYLLRCLPDWSAV